VAADATSIHLRPAKRSHRWAGECSPWHAALPPPMNFEDAFSYVGRTTTRVTAIDPRIPYSTSTILCRSKKNSRNRKDDAARIRRATCLPLNSTLRLLGEAATDCRCRRSCRAVAGAGGGTAPSSSSSSSSSRNDPTGANDDPPLSLVEKGGGASAA